MKKKKLPPAPEKKTLSPEKKQLFWQMLFNCAAFAAIYFLIAPKFPYIFYVYVSVAVILGFIYVIYNRGFAAKGITPEMLPDTMSYEEKLAFIEDSKQRLHKSKWMLSVLFPIIFVFALDMMYLYLLPMLQETFG